MFIPTLKSFFVLAMALGVAVTAGCGTAHKGEPPQASAVTVVPRKLAAGVWVSGQVAPRDLSALEHTQHIAAVIDLRPDGEQAEQPTASTMADAAAKIGVQFAYVPVAPGKVPPDAAVVALAHALANVGRPVLLYCGSGYRAARTWALVEAARPGGLDAPAIEAAVKAAGQPTDGLHDGIAARIAARSKAP